MTGHLTSLELRHAAALERFLASFDSRPTELHAYFVPRGAAIAEAVVSLDSWGKGLQLQAGWVPCSTWFWEEEGELQGVINVRHQLSPRLEQVGGNIGYCVAPAFRKQGVATRMLRAVLPECRALGLQRALLTCDSVNIGSRKTIESNGGVLDREHWVEDLDGLQRWYWIDLGKGS